MAKLAELTEEQLQQQLAKAAQRFKQATDNEEKLKIKKLHSAIKSELQRRQDTIDVAPEQSQTRLQEEWQEQNTEGSPIPATQQIDATSEGTPLQDALVESTSTDKPSAKKSLKKPGPSVKKKIGAKVPTSEAKKTSPKTPVSSSGSASEETPKKSSLPLYIGIGAAVLVLAGIAIFLLTSDSSNTNQGKVEKASTEKVSTESAPTSAPAATVEPATDTPSSADSTTETPKTE